MSALLEYKGYHGSIEADLEEGCLVGTVLHIDGVILYQGKTLTELEHDFRGAVDSYLNACAVKGLEPRKPVSGNVTARIGEELHRAALVAAGREGVSLNQWIAGAIGSRLGERSGGEERSLNRKVQSEGSKASTLLAPPASPKAARTVVGSSLTQARNRTKSKKK